MERKHSYGPLTDGSLAYLDELAANYEAQFAGARWTSTRDNGNLCFATTTRRLVAEVRRLRELLRSAHDLARSERGLDGVVDALAPEVVNDAAPGSEPPSRETAGRRG